MEAIRIAKFENTVFYLEKVIKSYKKVRKKI
jgi:hypothetical protein